MKILTIDTSTNTCSVALTIADQVVSELVVSSDRPLSSTILLSVDTVLQRGGIAIADIDCFGVAVGPGSFTGLRVGVATVKGLAAGTGSAAVVFSSLAMLAQNLPWAGFPVCPMFDARKKEIYAGLYRCQDVPSPLLPDCVTDPAAFLKGLAGPTIFVGEGAVRYRDLIIATLGSDAIFAPSTANQPRASAGAPLTQAAFLKTGGTPLHQLNPSYIRKSEAELAKMSGRI